MSKGFARAGWPRGSEVIVSGNVTASATPHTKGAWVELDASTAKDVVGLWVELRSAVSATDTSALLDVGIGAAAAEVVVVSNIPIGFYSTASTAMIRFFLPLYVPAGTRIALRNQSVVISAAIAAPVFVLVFGGRPGMWGGYSTAETIGVDTATSGPTTGDLADNAWDEAIASTANAYRAVTLHPCLPPGTTNIPGTVTAVVDVGVGGAGSEVLLGSWRASVNTSEMIGTWNGPDFIEADIPVGSRLAIRKNSTGDFSGALIGWR